MLYKYESLNQKYNSTIDGENDDLTENDYTSLLLIGSRISTEKDDAY